MAGLNTASDHAKIGLSLLLFSGLIFIISYGSPYWTTRDDGNAGLWAGCSDGICYERWNQWVATWIKVAQGFMTFALICWFFSTLCLVLYIFHKDYEDDKRLVCAAMLLILTAAFCVLIAVLVWISNEHMSSGEVLNWAYAFAWACALMFSLIGFLLYKELRRRVK